MKLNQNLKNTISLFSFEFFSRLLGFLAVTYLARILGTSAFGIINIGLAVLSYTMIFGSSGLNLLGTRKMLSKNGNAEVTGEIITARIILSILIYIITAVFLLIFITSNEIVSVILVYNLFLFPSAFLLEWFFQGSQRMDLISIGRIAGAAGYLVLILLLVKNPEDTVMTGAAWTGGGIISSLLLFYYFRKSGYSFSINFRNLKLFSLIKDSFPLGTAAAITSFVLMFPIIYLSISADTAAAGIYSAASKIIILLLVFDRVFSILFYPKIIKNFNDSSQNLSGVFSSVLKVISFFSLVAAVVAVLAAEPVISFVFGSGFADAVLPFQILTGYFALTLINSVFTYTLIGIGREKIYTASIFLGMIVFLAATLILTQIIGTAGPAAAMVLFEISSLLYMYFKLSQDFKIRLLGSILYAAAAAFIFIAVIIYFKPGPLLQLVSVALVGAPLLALLTRFTWNEVKFIKRIFA